MHIQKKYLEDCIKHSKICVPCKYSKQNMFINYDYHVHFTEITQLTKIFQSISEIISFFYLKNHKQSILIFKNIFYL